jgi:WD40 repeat protein
VDQRRWNQIEEILQAALDVDTGERVAFVQTACGSDVDLRNEVWALLAGGRDGSLLETPAAARMPGLLEPLRNGHHISHYRVEARIGIGGMGEVYRAHDERLRRTVALKALPLEFMSDSGRLHRFEQEAFAASRLNHPNIVTIFETLQADGVHLIATEHIEGQTLRAMLTNPQSGKPRKLPVEVALDVTMQVAAALKAAHTAWIIHRDIKPENIMVRSDGLVKVLDFGIAKLSEEPQETIAPALDEPPTSTLTIPGSVLGTTSYMSPEQARGAPLDGRTDIFSLGVVLYEMLTGERLFTTGTRAEVLHADDRHPLPHAVPKPLERVLRKMLHTDREQRYASAGELLDDLKRVKRTLDARTARRLIGVMGLTALIAVALTAVAALLSVTEVWEERVMHDGHTAAARQAVFSPDGRLLVSCGEDGRVIVWDFARRQRLATLHHPAYRIAFTPDGKSLVTGGTDGTITVWDSTSWREVRSVKGKPSEITALAFSPDATLMASDSLLGLSLWDTRRWERIRDWPSGTSYGTLLFSPDGRQLVSSYGFAAFDLEHWKASAAWAIGNSIALSPDTRRLAAVDSSGNVAFYRTDWRRDAARLELIAQYRAHQDHGRSVAFSPDGRLLASAADDIVVWDAGAQKKLARFEYSAIVWSVTFSPDGRWLISSHGDGAVLIWDIAERALVGNMNEHSGAVRDVEFAPDGHTLASASEDRTVIVWDVDRGRKRYVLTGHQTRVTAVAFSSDGKQLGSADQDGMAIVWNLATRQPRLLIRAPIEGANYCLALSRDGRYVATSYGVYSTAGGRMVLNLSPDGRYGHAYGASFSADSRRLATVTENGFVTLWDVPGGRLIDQTRLLKTHQICASLSADGKWLVTGEDEGAVRLWSVSPFQQVAILGRHAARVKSVAFAPDSLEVASAGDDKMIALWDVRRRTLRAHVGTHTSPVYAVAFSADGRQLASGEHDRSVRVYTRRRSLWGWRID